MAKLDVQIYNSINEIEPDVWNRIVARRGFQSHNWYRFGERAMADCPPTYLIARDGDTPIASAALFRVYNEPLPLPEVATTLRVPIGTVTSIGPPVCRWTCESPEYQPRAAMSIQGCRCTVSSAGLGVLPRVRAPHHPRRCTQNGALEEHNLRKDSLARALGGHRRGSEGG